MAISPAVFTPEVLNFLLERAFYHHKITEVHCRIPADQENIPQVQVKIIPDHQKMAADHMKMAEDHQKIIQVHHKMAQYHLKMMEDRTAASCGWYFVIFHLSTF